MRLWPPALVLLAVTGTAYAQQPSPWPEPTPSPAPDAAPTTEPSPSPSPTPSAAPAPAPGPAAKPGSTGAAPAPAAAREYRPRELSVAIGLGYLLPTSIQTPNVTSFRLRLASGLQFEPRLSLANSSETIDVGEDSTSSLSEIGIGALARIPVVKRGRYDLELLGGFDINNASTKPDADNLDISVTRVAAHYGLAVSAWINAHWQVSFSALNPVLITTNRNEQQGPGATTVTTDTTVGLIFDPTVTVMLHVYL